jgi:hypothetical protein
MTLGPELERELRQAVRQARLVAFTCCFAAPAMYLISVGSQALGSRWERFLGGFGRLPWSDPRVPWTLAAALLAFVLSLVLPGRLGHPRDPRSALGVLRARNLVRSALLAVVAGCGLYLGFRLGPPAASLCLVLCLAPMARGLFVFPAEARWREAMSRPG